MSWAFHKTSRAFLWLSWTSLGLSWPILSHLGSFSGPTWPKMAPESGLDMTPRRPRMNQDDTTWSQDGPRWLLRVAQVGYVGLSRALIMCVGAIKVTIGFITIAVGLS